MTLAGGEAPQRSTRTSARVCVDHCLAAVRMVGAGGRHALLHAARPADRGLSASGATTPPPFSLRRAAQTPGRTPCPRRPAPISWRLVAQPSAARRALEAAP